MLTPLDEQKYYLTRRAIRNKFRVNDVRGLEMIAHQKSRLRDFFKNNRNMKLNIRTEGLFEKPEYNDGGNKIATSEHLYQLPATRYNVHNEDELNQALENSVQQIYTVQFSI